MNYLTQLLHLVAEMVPYLLLGFIFAGLLHVLVPHKFYQKYLSQNNFRSVALASLFGIPLPLCSCGVIPTAMSLRKEGGSKAATTAFLSSTPQTGVDSILATFSVFGLAFAIIRPMAALISSLIIGSIVALSERKKSCVSVEKNTLTSTSISTSERNAMKRGVFMNKSISALKYAFVEMIEDIGGHMLLGLLVAGLISVALPENWLLSLANRPLLEMLAVMAFAVPMYVCATGSIPIAAALMLKGLTPGGALVFLMAGPAVNFASILVINKVLGKRITFIFVTSIMLCALIFGLCVDYFMPREWFNTILSETCHHGEVSWFQCLCLGFFAVLLINALVIRKYIKKKNNCSCHGENTCSCASESNTTVCEAIFHIEGMHCNHCRANLEEALQKLPGVTEAHVDLQEKQAWLKGFFTHENVIQCVESLGFTATPKE